MDDLICGFKREDIRKYYYDKKVSDLLFEAQKKQDLSIDDIKQLKAFLDELRVKEMGIIDIVKEVMGDDIDNIKPINNITMSDTELEEFKNDVKTAKKEVKEVVKQVQNFIRKEKGTNGELLKFSKDDLIDRAIILNNCLTVLRRYELYWENKYHKAIIDNMTTYHLTRKASEDMARFGVEYQNYKTTNIELSELEELILLIKKKANLDLYN